MAGGLYVVFRYSRGGLDPLGFVIKLASKRIFSERYNGYRRALRIGPLYFRTFARKKVEI